MYDYSSATSAAAAAAAGTGAGEEMEYEGEQQQHQHNDDSCQQTQKHQHEDDHPCAHMWILPPRSLEALASPVIHPLVGGKKKKRPKCKTQEEREAREKEMKELTERQRAVKKLSLDTSHNFASGPGRVDRLVQDVLASRSRLLMIDESKLETRGWYQLRDNDATVLAAALRNNTSFLMVALRNVYLSNCGFSPLFTELARHKTVRLIDLNSSIVPSECFKELREIPRQNSNVVAMDLTGCGVPDDILAEIYASCKLNLMCRPDISLANISENASTLDLLKLVLESCDETDNAANAEVTTTTKAVTVMAEGNNKEEEEEEQEVEQKEQEEVEEKAVIINVKQFVKDARARLLLRSKN